MKKNTMELKWSELSRMMAPKNIPLPMPWQPTWKSTQGKSWVEMVKSDQLPSQLKLSSAAVEKALLKVLLLASKENRSAIKSIIYSTDLIALQNKIQAIEIQQFEGRANGKKVTNEMFGTFWAYLFLKGYLLNKTYSEIVAFIHVFFTSDGKGFSDIRRYVSRDLGLDQDNQFIRAFEQALRESLN